MTVETWNRESPPGFQGLHPEIPVTFYYRHLPHWRQDGATYFITFRLADSLPQSKLRELTSIKREFAAKQGICGTDWQSVLRRRGQFIPHEKWEAFGRAQMQRVERWLDLGLGSCVLKRADIVEPESPGVCHPQLAHQGNLRELAELESEGARTIQHARAP